MIRNLTSAALIAAGVLLGMRATMADTAPPPAAPSAVPAASAATTGASSDALSRVFGGIGAVDNKADTITLTGFGGDSQTIAYDANTTYMLDIPATISDIHVGDTLRAFTFGGGDNGGAAAPSTSITPNFLNIVPPVDVNGPPFTGQFKPTIGVVASLSPLTITTADKTTITVTIGDMTRITKSQSATIADVKMGMFGSGIVKGTGTSQVFTELHVNQPPTNNN